MDHEVSSAMSGCHIYQVSSSLLVQDLDVCAYVASSSSSDVRPNLQTTCIPVVGEDLIAAAPKRISYLRWFDISTHTPMSDKSSYQARQVLCFLSIHLLHYSHHRVVEVSPNSSLARGRRRTWVLGIDLYFVQFEFRGSMTGGAVQM